MRVFPAVALGLVLGLPAAFVCAGLWLGLTTINSSPWVALVGLIEAIPSNDPMAYGTRAMLRILAVLGTLAWAFDSF